jgi:hypothetical protein
MVDGQWIKADEWLREQGFVRYKGAWRLPQEVELDTRRERIESKEIEWRKRLRVWRSAIIRRPNDREEAVDQIQAIDSPLAVTALAELLKEPREPRQLKLLYIDVLGKFDTPGAAAALLERVMKDDELDIAERCIEILRVHGTNQARVVLSKALKEKENRVINRAAWALGELGAPEAVPALIDALVTKHRFKIQSGGPGNTNAGFSPTGGNSFSTGGGTALIEKEIPNQQVLGALTKLTPDGVNFGYDVRAWKHWYAMDQIQPGLDLRRDF